jgi:hypothetical protein
MIVLLLVNGRRLTGLRHLDLFAFTAFIQRA